MKDLPFQRTWEKATPPGRGAARKRKTLSGSQPHDFCFQGEAKTELVVHSVLSDIKQTYPALCSCWRSLSVSYCATIVIALLSPATSVPRQQWDGPQGKQSIHELLILAHSVPLARIQTHIPALLIVLGCTLKGSTQQVMGCGQEGMQITTVPFQLWALKGGIQCLPDTPPAPGHSPRLCCLLHRLNAAHPHRPGSCWTFIPCFRGTRAGQQYPGDTARSTRTTTLLSV